MKTSPQSNAFTLIELLVVISIIAILAGIALPVFGEVQVKGAQTKALSNAKQIGLACRLYADDHNGNYPTFQIDTTTEKETQNPVGDSNEAFANLIPDYVQTEQIFFVPKSAFTKVPPDDKIASKTEKLKAGENHFALVLNLGTSSPSTYPLIADGFADKSQHTYTKDETKTGGVWKGKKAIVIKCDNSGSIEKLNSKLIVPGNPNGDDLFSNSATDWMGASNTVVNPL